MSRIGHVIISVRLETIEAKDFRDLAWEMSGQARRFVSQGEIMRIALRCLKEKIAADPAVSKKLFPHAPPGRELDPKLARAIDKGGDPNEYDDEEPELPEEGAPAPGEIKVT